jgi:hypothetical protein
MFDSQSSVATPGSLITSPGWVFNAAPTLPGSQGTSIGGPIIEVNCVGGTVGNTVNIQGTVVDNCGCPTC